MRGDCARAGGTVERVSNYARLAVAVAIGAAALWLSDLVRGLACTVVLGLLFTTFQVIEYSSAPFSFQRLIADPSAWDSFKLEKGGSYPSAFFMATGFHGFHVIIGTIFLCVCLVRVFLGQFTPQQHFGFEAAAWYWHFVDVVWLFLFTCIYVWGNAGGAYAG